MVEKSDCSAFYNLTSATTATIGSTETTRSSGYGTESPYGLLRAATVLMDLAGQSAYDANSHNREMGQLQQHHSFMSVEQLCHFPRSFVEFELRFRQMKRLKLELLVCAISVSDEVKSPWLSERAIEN